MRNLQGSTDTATDTPGGCFRGRSARQLQQFPQVAVATGGVSRASFPSLSGHDPLLDLLPPLPDCALQTPGPKAAHPVQQGALRKIVG